MRLVLVTRRFWPLVGEVETTLAHLADFFQASGCHVQILTPRWESHWPATLSFRGCSLTRLPHPKTRGWGRIWYMRSLRRWLIERREQYDLILVSSPGQDAFSVLASQKRHQKPVVIRVEESGPDGDIHGQVSAPFGMRIRRVTQQANHFIACSEAIQREMLEIGYAAQQITLIQNGVLPSSVRNFQRRAEARDALAETHRILGVAEDAPLVMYAGRLDERQRLTDLISIWPQILKTHPKARLWLVGEGDHIPRLWEAIRSRGLVDTVILTGSFDDLREVLYAVDAFVVPAKQSEWSLRVRQAMMAHVPLVACESLEARPKINDKMNGFVFPEGDKETLAETLLFVLQSGTLVRHCADHARQDAENDFEWKTMGQSHLDVMRKCLASGASQVHEALQRSPTRFTRN